ncbi:MAG TPA: Sjogren's syndrome/scleroderma autoantigen 1 family protein [Halococcus sp.]|nr:Sjogren's syndrome/scleroderma autoantigen 1 family protein [Halococcus sp.]
MSDFDEEAEREKLRKRFAEEENDRETTERMSELLLQGATMTNTHCDTCGNPLFRYDGQTFCSNCQRAVGDDASTETTEATEPATTDTPASDTEPSPEHPDGQRISVNDPHENQSADTEETRSQNASEARTERPNATPTRNRRTPPSQTASDGDTAGSKKRSGVRAGEGANDLAATEASLSRTLRELSSRAEKIDDLGRAREHLAAVREAAEALDAVRQARR